jgi:hypothetical protein
MTNAVPVSAFPSLVVFHNVDSLLVDHPLGLLQISDSPIQTSATRCVSDTYSPRSMRLLQPSDLLTPADV